MRTAAHTVRNGMVPHRNAFQVMQKGARKRFSLSFISERVQEVFAKLDSKGDGVLDAEELEAHLWSVGYKVSERDVQLMIWEAPLDSYLSPIPQP